MTINELLDKPVWQMTGEELLFLAQHGKMSMNGETTKTSSKEEKRYEQFVTRDEIEQIKKEIEYSAMTEARKEVISLLGGALAGVKNSQPVMVASPQEDMEEQPEDDVMNDADVAGLAMGWMSKGD